MTRSLVGSASSAFTTSSAGTVPSIRASNGNRAKASRSAGGPVSARVVNACVSEWPAAIEAPTSRRPSGHAPAARGDESRGGGRSTRAGARPPRSAGTSATSAVPVTKYVAANAPIPTAAEPSDELEG